MRVTKVDGTEDEAFADHGAIVLLHGGRMPAREFYRTHRPSEERRRGERRQTLERRRIPSLARRSGVSRRRLDHLTSGEFAALVGGYVVDA